MNDELQDVVDFGQMIGERYGQLTKSEKRIADYIRKNQEEAAFLAAGELADRLGLSEATLVRFARTLGFNSYPAMRALLQGAFRQRFQQHGVVLQRMKPAEHAYDNCIVRHA